MEISALRDQVESIRKDVGLFSGSAFLEESVAQLGAVVGDDRLAVDFILSTACQAFVNKNSFASYPHLDIRLISEASQLGCFVGLRRATVSVFACLSEELNGALLDQAEWGYFCGQISQCSHSRLWVIDASRKDNVDETALGVAIPKGIEVIRVASSTDLAEAFAGLDALPLMRHASMHKLMSIAPVVDRVKTIVAGEVSALTLRRQIIVSEQDRNRRSDSSNANEAQSTVRNVVQRNFQDTERVFRQKYDELSRPNVGALAQLIESYATSLGVGQIVKVDKAANFEKFESQIDPSFLSAGVTKLQRAFRQEMDRDAVYIKQLTKDTESSVSAALQQSGFGADALRNMVRPQLDLERLDQSHFRIAKAYKGELTKPGVMEYFGALRDYTGLIMVIVGILAPLTMLATAPEADKDSLLGVINEFSKDLKNIRAYIQFLTVILIFSMLSYGIFDLRRRIPNKRRQEMEKEIQEAREFVGEQLTRLLSDAHRDWSTMLGQYVKDYSQALQTELEVLMKKQASILQETTSERRNAAQLEQLSVEHKLKSFAVAERAVENLVRRYQDSVERMQTSLASRAGVVG